MNSNILYFLFSTLCLLFLSGCANESPPFAFQGSPASQKINNLYDLNGDKKSELYFWNTSTMPKPSEFLKPCFLEVVNITNSKYSKFELGEVGDIPFVGYFDQDSILDYGVYRYGQGINDWFIRNGAENSGANFKLGEGGDLPVPGDYNGDGKFDIVIYRPKDSSFRGVFTNSGATFSVQIGNSRDIPVPKDYDGDGVSDLATYRPTDGTWKIRTSGNSELQTAQLGGIHFLPLPADYDGDGKADLCVWNYLDNKIDAILTTLRRPLLVNVAEEIQRKLKGKDFFPVPLDYDGDGACELAFWSNSLKILLAFDIRQNLKQKTYKLNTVTNSEPVVSFLLKRLLIREPTNGSIVNIKNEPSLVFYKNGEILSRDIPWNATTSKSVRLFKWNKKQNVIPFVSDFDGDYILDSCLWSKDTGAFLCSSSRIGFKFALPIGLDSDVPVIGNLSADNITDIGVYRLLDHSFYVRYLGKSAPEKIQVIKLSEQAGTKGVPQIGDYDGDGIDDFAVYNPQIHTFVVRKSSDLQEIRFDFCKDISCPIPMPVTGDFDGDNKFDPGIIDLKTKMFSYYSSRDTVNHASTLDQRISGNPFSADIDQDSKSDLIFFDPMKKNWGISLSFKNGEYKEIKFSENNIKLVNCPWLYK